MDNAALRSLLAQAGSERDVVVFDGAVELRIDRLTVEPGLVIIHAYAD